jgi:hypothetical protein
MMACAGLEYFYSIEQSNLATCTTQSNVENPDIAVTNESTIECEEETISEQYKKLFVKYGLSDDIPEYFTHLRLSAQSKYPSFGKLLSLLRNKITHYNPDRLRFMTDYAFVEAKLLAILRLEQLIMHKCNAKKVYTSINYRGIF